MSRVGSFEARGPAFTFPASRTLHGPTAFPDEWNESSSTNASTSNQSTSSQISTSPYPIDSTFGWYDTAGDNNCRPLNSLRGLQDHKPECMLEGKVRERDVLIDLKRSRCDPGYIRIYECQRTISR